VNTAQEGRAHEQKSRDLLEAAGSMGMWDLVGLGPVDVVLCQVRSRDCPGPLERAALADFTAPPTRASCCTGIATACACPT
jgi:hypothetical protein